MLLARLTIASKTNSLTLGAIAPTHKDCMKKFRDFLQNYEESIFALYMINIRDFDYQYILEEMDYSKLCQMYVGPGEIKLEDLLHKRVFSGCLQGNEILGKNVQILKAAIPHGRPVCVLDGKFLFTVYNDVDYRYVISKNAANAVKLAYNRPYDQSFETDQAAVMQQDAFLMEGYPFLGPK
jgi:hypothetical protein